MLPLLGTAHHECQTPAPSLWTTAVPARRRFWPLPPASGAARRLERGRRRPFRPSAPLVVVESCGRYWFRTSDLCRVKAALSR